VLSVAKLNLMTEVRYNPLLHRTAQLTAAATLLLIFMGGLVTSHGAGLSVPDWPNSYGYNMFTFPPSKWIGGIFYEHTHRLMGIVVGMLSIALTIIAWKSEERKWVRWLTTSVLFAVIFQGVLGGLRVILIKLNLAIVHACVAEAFFCLTALVCVVTSKWWLTTAPTNHLRAGRLVPLLVCCIAIYFQLIIGASMRHYQAGLAIPDFPLSYGKLLPPTNDDELRNVIMYRRHWDALWEEASPQGFTLAQVWLSFAHRMGAALVTVLLLPTIVMILRRESDWEVRLAAWQVMILLISQLTLGILTVLFRKPADVASLHVAVGALTLMTTFVLLVRCAHLYFPAWKKSPRGFEIHMSPTSVVTA
jgi:cytochrome c oxidase assembly protein subunit 15